MKGKLERWFSKAWDLETVSLFTLASGFKQKNYKVFTIETKSSSKKSKSSILATHRVRIWSSSFVFTFFSLLFEQNIFLQMICSNCWKFEKNMLHL